MAIGAIWTPSIDQETYDAVRGRVLEAGMSAGMRVHAAGQSEQGWRVIEVWESRERLERFMRETLYPAIDELSGGQAAHPEPEVFDVYFGRP